MTCPASGGEQHAFTVLLSTRRGETHYARCRCGLRREDWLTAQLAEAYQKLVDAGELHLADEQTIRNIERKLAGAQAECSRWQEIAQQEMLTPLVEAFPEIPYEGRGGEFVASIIERWKGAQAACAELQIGLCRAVDYIQTRAPEPNVLALVLPIVERALASSPGRPWAKVSVELARLREENKRLRDRCEERAGELLQLREQSERPKCAYCDFGERDLVPLDLLKWHVEKECGNHPIRALKDTIVSQADALRLAVEALGPWHVAECHIEACSKCRALIHPAMTAARGRA